MWCTCALDATEYADFLKLQPKAFSTISSQVASRDLLKEESRVPARPGPTFSPSSSTLECICPSKSTSTSRLNIW